MSKRDRFEKNAKWRFWDIFTRGGDASSASRRAIDFASDAEATRNWILGALGFFAIVGVGILLVAFLGLKVKQAFCEHEAFNHDKVKIVEEVEYKKLTIECARCKKDFTYKAFREREIVVEGTCKLEGFYNVIYPFGVIDGVDYTEKKMYSSGFGEHVLKVINEQINPTCTLTGKTKREKCIECNELFGYETIEPLGHDIIDEQPIAPTCYSYGSTGGKICSRCDYIEVEAEILNPIEHTHVLVETKEATYNTTGYKKYVCSMCNIDEYLDDIVEPFFSNYATYGGNDSNRIIFSAKPGVEHLDIPDTIDGITVTEIDLAAFKQNEELKSIKLPSGLKTIDDFAFSGCINLESIILPEGLTYIGRESFAMCKKLTSITIPATVKRIEAKAFVDCINLREVNLSEGLQVIDGYAFQACENIMSLKLPSTLTYIEYGAFQDCTGMLEIYDVNNTFTNRYPENIIKVHNDLSEPSAIFNQDECLFILADEGYILLECYNNGEEVILPDSVNGESYEIRTEAFKNLSNVKKMTIPQISGLYFSHLFESVSAPIKNYYYNNIVELTVCAKENIPSSYFSLPNLKKLTISNDVLDVNYSFDVDALEELIVPAKNDYRIMHIFSGTIPLTFKKLVISEGENIPYQYAYDMVTIEELILPEDLKTIGTEAFFNCNKIENIILPISLVEIGIRAFQDCKSLKTVYNLSDLDIKIGDINHGFVAYYAMAVYKSLDEESKIFEFGDFTYLQQGNIAYLFEYKGSDTVINLPNDINGLDYIIGKNCFYNNSKITEITIPEKVVGIDAYAFYQCINLKQVTLNANINQIKEYTFYNCNNSEFKMTSKIKEIGDYAFYYNKFTEFNYLQDVEKIGNYAFQNCIYLTSVTCGDNLITIGDYAYSKCAKLITVSLADKVEIIGNYAFNECNNLVTINASDTLTTIGDYAFYCCTKLETFNFENCPNLKVIGEAAFYECTSITKALLPNGFTTLGRNAFYKASNLREIYIPETVNQIRIKTFYYATKVNKLTMPVCIDMITYLFQSEGNLQQPAPLEEVKIIGLKNIPLEFFNGLKGTKTIKIDDRVQEIGDSACFQLVNLINLELPSSLNKIGIKVFTNCFNLNNIKISNNNNYEVLNGNCLVDIRTNTLVFGNKNITIPTNVVALAPYSYYYEDIETITIPSNIKTIGEYAFSKCSKLTSVIIEGQDVEIKDYSFSECALLEKVEMKNVKTIGLYAFTNCNSLEYLILPTTLTTFSYQYFKIDNIKLYYEGDKTSFENVSFMEGNYSPDTYVLYYYSSNTPSDNDNYWRYDENQNIVIW